MVISVLEDYCLMVEQLVSGWPRGIGPDDEDIQAAIRFVEYQLQQVRDDDKIKMLEQAAVRLLWMRRHSESELFVDENRSMLQKEGNYNIDLTARQPKDKLVGILEEAGKVVLIDSTPPPTRWSDLWLGKVFDIDVLTLNPATQPDIRVWVENAERRWSYMDRHQGVMDRQFAFLNKICLYNDEKWIISTRNKMETNAMSYLREFGNEVIWQGGVESEGVQLSGNHVLTGLQYTYNASYPSQKKYILEKIGKDPDSDEEWDKFLRLRTYQSIIQQLFRTYYHNRKARMILLGTPVEEIERMTKAYPYLKLVKFSLMPKGQHIKNKMGQLERFLEDDEFIEDKNDFIKKRILANFEFNSVTRTQIYNFLNRYDMPRTKVVLDEMNWKGSGSGRY